MTKRAIWAIAGATLLATTAGAQVAPKQPPAPPARPVTDTYFGTTVTDPYRFMEKLDDPAVTAWMKAQGDYTRAVLDSVPARAAVAKRIAAFTGSFAATQSVQRAGGRVFYLERAPGSDNFDLMVRDAGGGAARKLVDVAALRAAKGGKPHAINYYLASPAGDKIALGVSEGGSEDAALTVLDVATGRQVAGPVPLARFGATGWSDDGRLLFINLQAELAKGAPETDTFKNSRALVWDLAAPPVPLFGGATASAIKVAPERFPYVLTRQRASHALGIIRNGVQNEVELWTVPAAAASRADAPWTRVALPEDEVTGGDIAGNRLFLLSHKDAPTFKVLALDAGQPLSAARTLVAARPDRLIENIAAASDGLYVLARQGLYSTLFRVPYDGGAEQPVALPVRGSISDVSSDPTRLGVGFTLDSWATPPTSYAYDGRRLVDLKLGTAPAGYDPRAYAVSDFTATAKDGTAVPLSHVGNKGRGRGGPQPTVLWAYGSYGISEFPYFSPRWAMLLEQGINVAVCHARGGGELGEAWRLAGKDANKPNTWRDVIACGEELVRRGATTPAQLVIMGGSAGGIPMGRAMEEAPQLFAGVIDAVPLANPVRVETSANGVPNIPEFGTVTTEQGFRNLYAMDSYLNVTDGTRYPPIMITTGLNDPRVIPWQPAKFAARLLAAGGPNPVLLRIDADGGHGIGSTKAQGDALNADVITFVKWSTGDKAWAPRR